MTPNERRRAILRALSPTEVHSVNALSRLTGVSVVTVRRDLTELAHEGLVTRVHGGALRAPRRGAARPVALRRREDVEAKRLLARATADLIEDGESVIVDNGTTCEMVAEQLAGRSIRALCLSLGAACALASVRGATVTTAGGPVDPESLSLMSTEAVDAVRAFRADVAVLSACAVSVREGLTVMESVDAMIKRSIIASSARRLLPMTPSKLSTTNTYRFGRIEDLDTVLTTADIDADAREGLREAGVEVVICR
ncbi:MAG: DeoR/GlpR family DNA-binding transcription regulator [Actinomyces sp.]|uniref:DeoR/GlpR family DNA-binding transcription regulator n=1 Tax=Actinomyces sp. TaxID=29317 RepID=UPI0026DC37A9|nr:DeoR/GlpR family DNA-binding transcription regulator [Actinomyces sp.]MDO4244074.1 DeoR/GlpR family DNA-binding transcription regulator [Actinomyces sp.]